MKVDTFLPESLEPDSLSLSYFRESPSPFFYHKIDRNSKFWHEMKLTYQITFLETLQISLRVSAFLIAYKPLAKTKTKTCNCFVVTCCRQSLWNICVGVPKQLALPIVYWRLHSSHLSPLSQLPWCFQGSPCHPPHLSVCWVITESCSVYLPCDAYN